MTPLLNFSAGSISLIPRTTFKNTKKDVHLNKCNFKRTALLLPQPNFPLNWISTRSISKTRILTSAVEADVAVEADPNPKPETSEQAEPLSEQTEQAASTEPAVKVRRARPGRKSGLPPVNKEDLVPGATFTGVVRSIQSFGLFVDFGAFNDGLVHISQISSSYVKDVKALFTVGQEVEVRLLEYDMQAGRISLTMRAPGDDRKEGRRGGRGRGRTRQQGPRYLEGDICSGTVKKIIEEGALVTLPGGGEGFLPVSEQVVVGGSEGGATLEVNQEIEVRILSVIGPDITLTMKEDEYVDKQLLEFLKRKKEGPDTSTLEIIEDREFEVFDILVLKYEEEGEEVEDDTEEVVDHAALENPSLDVDDDTILANPFVSAFLRSRYADNAKKQLELIGAVKKAGSVVDISTASVSGDAGGEVVVAGDGSEVGSVSIAEEPVAVTEVEGGEAAAVGAVSETGYDPVADEPVATAGAVPEVSASEVVSDSPVTEPSTVATDSTTEASFGEVVSDSTVTETSSVATDSTTEASVAEPLVTDEQVAAAEAVPEVSKSEVSSEIGSVSVAEEPVAISEVEKSEVAAAEAVPEVAEREVASESTVTEASTGTTDSTTEAPLADEPASVISENSFSDSQAVLSENDASEIAASGKTEENASDKTAEAVSINVGDEKTEVSEAIPEASPNQAREVKATISPSLVKKLRDETGAGMMDCKKALAETNGDLAKAQEYLRKKGLASADKKASRATAEGRIGSYVHDGRIGVLIEVNCETDFVSRGDIFKELVEDLAMQVAACPQVTYLTSDEVPEETVQKEKEIEMQREDILSKPENIREKIVEGRIRKRLEEFALLEQPFIKNDKVVLKDYVKQTIATIGENIKVNRFVRFNLGEGLEKKSQDFAAEVAAQTSAKPAAAAPPSDEQVETIETEDKAPAITVTISPALVKMLRDETGAGMMDCKKALTETGGDIEKAQEYLRKKCLSSADKKSSRLAAEGLISAYIHDSRIGCLIEVNSETDFVARNEKFKELVSDLAMQIVACPQVEYVSVDEVPASVVEKEKAIEMQREDLQSKPEQIREKIVEGRISKRLGELALLEQPFIKDDSITVKELVKRTIASLGENIKVRRFVRFTLGESTD